MKVYLVFLLWCFACSPIPECKKDDFLLDEKEKIGKGGQGAASTVYDNQGNKYVYKKYKSRKGFKRELFALEQISHPNIIQVHCKITTKKAVILPYYVDGDLSNIEYGFPDRLIRHFSAQLIVATNAVHVAGFVHTDIKPANLVRDGDHLFLIDFGLAMEIDEIYSGRGTSSTMSPEMAFQHDDELDVSLDWWSVGARIWQLNTLAHQRYSRSYKKRMRPYRLLKSEGSYYDMIKYPMPDYFPSDLVDLMDMLLADDPAERKFTLQDFIHHPYFNNVDWML